MHNDHVLKVEDIEDNIYFKNNNEKFIELVSLINGCKGFFSKLKLIKPGSKRYQKYGNLIEWINSQTPKLSESSFEYSFATKCYWITHNLTDFPTCPICHSNENFKNKNIHFWTGYCRCCSRICATKDPERTIKIINTQNSDPLFWEKRNEKSKQTSLLHYGVENPSQSPEIKDKKRKTCMDHFGVECNLAASESQEKRKATWKKKYGVEHISQSEYYKSTYEKTSFEKYGYNHPMKNPEFRRKNRQRYIFNNIIFDSSWEIAYYIYLRDHNINFIYQPDDKMFEYYVNDKVKRYFPDFKVNDEYVEIKGDHMIDKTTNHWIPPPYVKKLFTEDEYKNECAAVEAKYQCAIANNVKILSYSDCQKYINYVNDTYGKNYIKSFKMSKSKRDLQSSLSTLQMQSSRCS